MQLFVVLHSAVKITLVVRATDTIRSVKEKIQEREGISVSEQRLVYVTEELNNEKTLRDYNFISGGTMYLCMTLFAVILGGKTIVLRVSGDDTISDVKKKIQDREGIPPDEQRLVYKSKELWDNHLKLADHDFKNDGTIFLTMRLIGGKDGY